MNQNHNNHLLILHAALWAIAITVMAITLTGASRRESPTPPNRDLEEIREQCASPHPHANRYICLAIALNRCDLFSDSAVTSLDCLSYGGNWRAYREERARP